jgi:hypothetical protein
MFSFPPVKRVVYFPPYAPRQSASNHLYVVECAQACNNYGKCITMYNAALDYGPLDKCILGMVLVLFTKIGRLNFL